MRGVRYICTANLPTISPTANPLARRFQGLMMAANSAVAAFARHTFKARPGLNGHGFGPCAWFGSYGLGRPQ
jgi:hypothetical protein